jgi:molybdenum cofactor cytidylyltransferase
MKSISIILLAAGGSSRLGRPKQLLQFEGTTLVQRALDAALEAKPKQVVVVEGAHRGLAEKSNTAIVVENKDWQEGIASSIRSGLNTVLEYEPGTDAVIFMVCDQPYVTGELLKEIMTAHESSGKDIVASSYAGTVGIPALFSKSYFDALRQLKGDEGAKKIILKNTDGVALVDFPKGNIDIDTAGDYATLQGKDIPPV